MTISRMRRHAPFGPTDPNFCMWGGSPTCSTVQNFWKSVQGFRSWKTLKNRISHWKRLHLYNSVALQRRLW